MPEKLINVDQVEKEVDAYADTLLEDVAPVLAATNNSEFYNVFTRFYNNLILDFTGSELYKYVDEKYKKYAVVYLTEQIGKKIKYSVFYYLGDFDCKDKTFSSIDLLSEDEYKSFLDVDDD